MFQQLEEFQVVEQKLGLLINFKKFQACTAVPVQIIQCLGSVFNNRLGIIYPSQERFRELMSHMHMICSQQVVTAQSILRCLGMMMASFIDIILWSDYICALLSFAFCPMALSQGQFVPGIAGKTYTWNGEKSKECFSKGCHVIREVSHTV